MASSDPRSGTNLPAHLRAIAACYEIAGDIPRATSFRRASEAIARLPRLDATVLSEKIPYVGESSKEVAYDFFRTGSSARWLSVKRHADTDPVLFAKLTATVAVARPTIPTQVYRPRVAAHVHTNWSDGADSVMTMDLEARRLGFDGITVVDHLSGSRAGVLDTYAILEWERACHGLQYMLEVDVMPDGTLNLPQDCEDIPFIAALHLLPSLRGIERFCKVLEHASPWAVTHLPSYDRHPIWKDFLRLLQRRKTVVEITPRHPMDLTTLQFLADEGVPVVVGSDAHSRTDLADFWNGIELPEFIIPFIIPL